MISREKFEDENFYRERNTRKQALVLAFLLKNKASALKTEEVAMEIYGNSDKKNIANAYYILSRLYQKGYIEKKTPYWAIKPHTG